MHLLAALFWNRAERRLRAGWRIVIHLLFFLMAQGLPALILAPNLIVTALNSSVDTTALTAQAQPIPYFFLILLSLLSLTWLTTRFIDQRRFVQLGFAFSRHWWIDLLFGLALGAALMSVIFVCEWLLGWITITDLFVRRGSQSIGQALLAPLIVFLVVGIQEELIFRGYQIRNLAEGLHNTWLNETNATLLAWLLSSAIFGLVHRANPNATWLSTFNVALAGIFLGSGYVLTRQLAIPIGLHITWNFFQGAVFGFPVSGNDFGAATIFAIQQGGPDFYTGGAFGPEAGLIGIIAIVLGTLAVWGWVSWRYGAARIDQRLARYAPRGQRKLTDV